MSRQKDMEAAPRVRATKMESDPENSSSGQHRNKFLEKVRESNAAIHNGDFSRAVRLYSEAIDLDPANHILYSNRSAAYSKLGQFEKAYQDAKRARELNPKWSKAYYREGVALQCLGKDADALAAYASGLAQDPKSTHLLTGMLEAVMKSPLQDKLAPIIQQLQRMKLAQSPFVVISVIGQELLAGGCFAASMVLLESALRIGTCSLKLKGSVFSALSSAHWGLGNIDKAIACMLQDLAIAKSLGDQEGECRAHGNLGAAYFSKGNYKEGLTHHRFQLVLAMRLKDRNAAASALSSLGHVYTAIGDYPNALASHKQCVLMVKQDKDRIREAREIGNVGAVYLAMGDFDSALECHNEHLKIAKQMRDKIEEARAYSNLGSAHHYKRNYDQAISYHNQVLNISQDLTDKTLEARAYAGLGHAARGMMDYGKARHYHEKQLDNALQTKDKVAEGRACSNLGIIYQQLGEFDAALKLHKAHLKNAKDLGERASQGRAYGNIGNAYSSMQQYEVAVRFHKQELAISREVNDRHSEASTHGNLAVSYQALKMNDKALEHYQSHLRMSRELHDTVSEAKALQNLGNYYSSLKAFPDALPYYEQYLTLAQELQDVEGEGKACHRLGYAHYCLGNHREAVRYYEQDLALAKDTQDKTSLSRAYCNLGLAHKALGDLDKALECQKYFLATAHMNKNLAAKFCALGNIGDVLMKKGETEEGVKMFNQQLQLAKTLQEKKLEASAYGSLGAAHRLIGMYDKALAYHTQELTIYQELGDLKGECASHGNLGNVHMALGNYTNAYRCYEEQLDRARDLKDASIEAQSYGNLGITKMNMGHFEDAIGMFEQQLAMLEQVSGAFVMLDKGRAFGNLGDCYEALGDFEEAVKCQEQYLAIAHNSNNVQDQDRAYRGLGNAHRAMGNLQQSLVCFEKRLVVAHELDKPAAKGSAYGELGCLHSLLGNFEQAISCLQHQLRIAREMSDRVGEGEAACGLGGVYQQMGEYEHALEYHQLDLEIAEETRNSACQCRAYGNLGLSHESLGNFEKAISFQEEHLSIAAQINDKAAKTLAYSSLGRVHHAIGNYRQAVQYLQQGLQIAEQLGRREDEAKIRHRLGLALWGNGDLEEAQRQLYRAAELFEMIRREAQISSDYKLSLFDLQTASYQALQRVLVALGRTDEALVVAERGRTRAFVDLLVERQQMGGEGWYNSVESAPVTREQILDLVAKQQAAVLYFSIAAGFLYSWLITPKEGIVKFHECSVNELEVNSDPEDSQSLRSVRSLTASTTSLLDQYVGHVRESLGVESHLSASRPSLNRSSSYNVMSETESEADDLWQQHLEELGDKLNAENDRTGFLRMVNRNHIFNCSSYSLSSLLSLGSNGGLLNSRGSSTRRSTAWNGKPPLTALYELLIAPMEESLSGIMNKSKSELVIVLQGDLYLVPFSVLKATGAAQFLFEKFTLLAIPSIRALQASQAISKHNRYNPDCSGAVVIGNPKLPMSVVDQWQWGPLPGAEQECKMVGEMLGCKSHTGPAASKENVMRQIQRAEVLHFVTHVSWKLAAIVLSPGEFSGGTTSIHGNFERMDLSESSNSDLNSSFDGPSLSEFLLTAADVLNVKISAKLVVLSSGHTDDRAGRINSDGVVGLTRAFLAAGAECVLFALWPVPEMASRILLKSFYTGLLQGTKSSVALSDAMRSVQNSRQFSHPSNWACWLLVGSDIKLSSKVALMGHSLCELLREPSKSREAMRVVLHLVEKSLQRIHHGQRSAMYTTQASIENKVGDAPGWRDLLTSVGFRFEASTNGLPASVFFPTSDPGDRLTQCSASLQALLGLSIPTLGALSKMLDHPDVGEALTALVRDVNNKYNHDGSVELQISVRLWRAPGCHEFLASLGFDLVDVGKDEVTVKAGKQANRRTLQFALQALVAVFDTSEAPRSLFLDSSSSMESLCSTGSATSTSNFSKGSSPPGSPNPSMRSKRSFFNPAEVDRMPSAQRPKGHKYRQSARSQGPTSISLHLSHQSTIRQKYSSTSDTSGPEGDGSDNPLPRGPGMDDSLPVADSESVISQSEDGGPGLLSFRARQNLFERGGPKTFFPSQPPPNVYSTSASDSEENNPGSQRLTRAQSKSSLASGRSTGSAGSSGPMRRTRFRSSNASTKSSASDKTLGAEHKSGQSNESDLKEEVVARVEVSKERRGSVGSRASVGSRGSMGSRGSAASRGSVGSRGSGGKRMSRDPSPKQTPAKNLETEHEVEISAVPSGGPVISDPTALARKVLEETVTQRAALERMQRMSIHSLQQRRLAEMLNEAGLQHVGTHDSSSTTSDSTATTPTPSHADFSAVRIASGSQAACGSPKSLGSGLESQIRPVVHVTPTQRSVHDEIAETQLTKMSEELGSSSVTLTSVSPSNATESDADTRENQSSNTSHSLPQSQLNHSLGPSVEFSGHVLSRDISVVNNESVVGSGPMNYNEGHLGMISASLTKARPPVPLKPKTVKFHEEGKSEFMSNPPTKIEDSKPYEIKFAERKTVETVSDTPTIRDSLPALRQPQAVPSSPVSQEPMLRSGFQRYVSPNSGGTRPTPPDPPVRRGSLTKDQAPLGTQQVHVAQQPINSAEVVKPWPSPSGSGPFHSGEYHSSPSTSSWYDEDSDSHSASPALPPYPGPRGTSWNSPAVRNSGNFAGPFGARSGSYPVTQRMAAASGPSNGYMRSATHFYTSSGDSNTSELSLPNSTSSSNSWTNERGQNLSMLPTPNTVEIISGPEGQGPNMDIYANRGPSQNLNPGVQKENGLSRDISRMQIDGTVRPPPPYPKGTFQQHHAAPLPPTPAISNQYTSPKYGMPQSAYPMSTMAGSIPVACQGYSSTVTTAPSLRSNLVLMHSMTNVASGSGPGTQSSASSSQLGQYNMQNGGTNHRQPGLYVPSENPPPYPGAKNSSGMDSIMVGQQGAPLGNPHQYRWQDFQQQDSRHCDNDRATPEEVRMVEINVSDDDGRTQTKMMQASTC